MAATKHIVYVARADINTEDRTLPRDTKQPVAVFPTQSKRKRARRSLQQVFETFEDAPIIPLFESFDDATRRAKDITQRKKTEDSRVLEVDLVGNLYRELRQFVQEVEYTGQMPRIDGRAFLVFAKLKSRPLTEKDIFEIAWKEEKEKEKEKEEKEKNEKEEKEEKKKENKKKEDKKKEEKKK